MYLLPKSGDDIFFVAVKNRGGEGERKGKNGGDLRRLM